MRLDSRPRFWPIALPAHAASWRLGLASAAIGAAEVEVLGPVPDGDGVGMGSSVSIDKGGRVMGMFVGLEMRYEQEGWKVMTLIPSRTVD